MADVLDGLQEQNISWQELQTVTKLVLCQPQKQLLSIIPPAATGVCVSEGLRLSLFGLSE